MKRIKRILLWQVLLGWFLTAGMAVCAQYQVKSWTTDDGLPQNTVYSIVQTTDGYLWLATLDGLVRYDGVRFTVFNKNNTPGIETNRLRKLVIDGNGDLWISTEANYVIRYHQGKFQSYGFKSERQNNYIRNVFLNPASQIVAFTDAGIFRWNGERFEPYRRVAGETAYSNVLWSKTGAYWYSERDKVFQIENGRTFEYKIEAAKEASITNLYEDRRGRVWIGTPTTGLYVVENKRLFNFSAQNRLSDASVEPRIEDRDGNLWLASSSGAIIVAPDGKINRQTVADGLSENALGEIYQDRENNVWIGTVHRGLNRLNRRTVEFYSTADGLAAESVTPIYEDETGDIWLGGGGLTRWRTGVFSKIGGNERFGADVTTVYRDRENRLWFGNWETAYYSENGAFLNFFEKFGTKAGVFNILQDSRGWLWFATDRGLFRYADERLTRFTSVDGLAGDDVKLIHESKDGTLWIGTASGLTQLEDGVFTSFTTKDGLASNLVRAFYEDAGGTFWIGSYDGGLTRLKDGRFTRYTTKDGLFNDGVFQILEDESNNLWMSSNRGIYRISKQQLNDFADGRISHLESIAYSKEDGLLETECNGGQQPAGIVARDGKLWFPTQRGVAVIDPNNIKANPLAPPVLIEDIKIDNQSLAADLISSPNLQTAIEIAPDKTNVEIAYTGLSFVKPEFVKFRYRLEGLDGDWTEAETRRTAYYSYLPPGEYTFRVVAANPDGVWNTDGAAVKFVVVPPYYRTWWFLILSVSLIGAAVVTAYRRRVNRLEREKVAQQAFSSQLIESQEQDRKRIAAELHDGLGQSLVIIKNRAVLSLDKRDNPIRAFEQLDEIALAATEAINEVREITYNLRPYQLDRLGLSKAVASMIRRAAGEIEFETEIDNVDRVFPSETEINVYRIVQESINNIVKHSNAEHAKIQITRRANAVEMLIRDDGKGFNAANVESGFGLTGINERARMLGGSFAIQSTLGQGTILNIKLPVKPNE